MTDATTQIETMAVSYEQKDEASNAQSPSRSVWVDPAPSQTAARELRAQAEALNGPPRRMSPPRSDSSPMTPARTALAIVGSIALVAAFFGFWYGMIVGVPGHAPSRGHTSLTWNFARYGWCALITWVLAKDLKRGKLVDAWAVARQVTLRIVGQNLLILAAVIIAAYSLDKFFPVLDRSWLYLLPEFRGHSGNIGLMPVEIKYFGIAFVCLLAVSIPA